MRAMKPLVSGGVFATVALAVLAGRVYLDTDKQGEAADAARPPALELGQPANGNPLRGDTSGKSSAALVSSAQGSATAEAKPAADAKSAAKGASSGGTVFKKGKGKHSGEPFDPIKENGQFFVGWEKPKLVLLLTGREDGYFEPCGCAGLDRMKGGLSRRYSLLEELRTKRGWPVLALDSGGLIKGFGKQAELKLQITIEAMRKMGYDAIALGKNELKLPTGEVVAHVMSPDGKETPFISANVGLLGLDSGITPTKRVLQANGLKVGITSVLGKKYAAQLAGNDQLQIADPDAALQKVLPQLKQENCNLLVLLAHATVEECTELAKKYPEFGVVVMGDGAPEPPIDRPQVINNRTLLVEVGEKGMNAVALGFFDDPKQPVRYQRVVLDSRYASAKPIVDLMAAYQFQLKDLWESLTPQRLEHPKAATNGQFVGSEKCANCHELSYKVWKKSGHSKAYETLVKAEPPRQYDPQCISCHVVGWHPTEYFPYKGGFSSMEKTPQLIDVGCESCHGPGENHVKAEMGSDFNFQEQMRKAVVVTKEESEKHQCVTCHDLDNSPDFDFEAYWPNIEHYETE